MVTTNRAIRTGSGIHSTRRNLSSRNQPLKPKSSGKRGGYVLAALLVCVALVTVQNRADISEFLNRSISKVRIENQWQRISEAEVGKVLAPFMGNGFFDFDVLEAKEALELHPWILKASVTRVWPGTLSLHLTEQVAIARWGNEQLLNQYGDIFQPERLLELNSLPLLTGPKDSQEVVMLQYQKLNQILFPAGLRLSGLGLSKRGSWDYLLNEQMQVAAGRDDVFEKTQRFIDFYLLQPFEKSSQFLSIDLRYGNGIAVRDAGSSFTGVAIR
ncbi:MAG: cell division protein FtsQ/DivIB [Gammaproteobacteria bacterium]|nr:cell division protein FtsQ/DivIB [Gammaproteobacteria bacterium]